MRLPKIIALLYVFSTNSVASKKLLKYLSKRQRKRHSKELKDVFTKEEYVQFSDLAFRPGSEDDDFGVTLWSMGLSKPARVRFINKKGAKLESPKIKIREENLVSLRKKVLTPT